MFDNYLNICNFVVDTTPLTDDQRLGIVLKLNSLKKIELALRWLWINQRKLNSNKCNVVVSGHKYGKKNTRFDIEYFMKLYAFLVERDLQQTLLEYVT